MKKLILVLALLLLCLTMVPGAMAETLTGTLGADNYNSTIFSSPVSGSHYLTGGTKIDANPFQNTDGMVAIDVYYTSGAVFDAGAPAGTAVPFVAYLANSSAASTNQSGVIIGTGYIGYQRLFTVGGTEYGGHLWIQFDNYDTKGYTGAQYLYLEYNKAAFYNFNLQAETSTGAPAGYFIWDAGNAGTYAIAGDYTELKHNPVYAEYTANKPGGIGINGSITKTTGLSQAFVVNAAGTTVASEATLSNATLNFSVSSEQIKIGIYSLSGWYNSTLLFSPGVTPTPTVTPPINGTFTAQFYVKDNGNSTLLQNVYVELHRHDTGDSMNAGYTDSAGQITFADIPFPTYAPGYNSMEARFFKTGYQYSAWTFIPTGDFFHLQYLIPETGQNPTIASTVNITVHSIDASNGNANLASAYVEVYPNVPGPNGVIDWDYKLTGITNASGLITFQNVPAGAYNRIKTTKLGYTTDDYSIGIVPLWDFSHNAYLSTFGVTPTPTPLPQTGTYILSISPTTVPNGGNTTGTLSSTVDPTLASIQQIWYVYGDPSLDTLQPLDFFSEASDFFEASSTSHTLQYIKSGGNWIGWDTSTTSFSNSKGASIPNPANLIFEGLGGTKTVYCAITLANGTQYYLKGSVVVGAGAGQITTNVHSIDALTGGQLFNTEIDILNENTGEWKNRTYISGQASITTPAGTYLSFYGSLAGYTPATLLHKIAVSSPSYQLRFYESGISPGAGNQTFYVTVESQSGTPLSGAVVVITEVGGASQTKTTAEGGTISFVLNQSTTYIFRVTKIGYSIGAGSFTTDTATVGSTHIQLTVAPITTTPTPTITPVIIPTGTGGNYTGFWGPLAEGAKGAGASTGEIPLMLAGLFIFVGFCIGGWSGAAYGPAAFNGQASMAGGVFGFVLSCMFGFIPIVWVISIIIIGVFVFIFFTRS